MLDQKMMVVKKNNCFNMLILACFHGNHIYIFVFLRQTPEIKEMLIISLILKIM